MSEFDELGKRSHRKRGTQGESALQYNVGMLNRLLVEINNRSLRAKPNETLSSIEYKHRLLLAVDQPRDV